MKILSLSVALLHHIQSHWQALDILNIYCDISSCIVINVSFVTVVYSYWIDQLLYCCHCYHSHTLMFMIWGNYRVSYKNARNFLKSWHFCLPTRFTRHLPGLWRDIRINMIFATRFLLALAISEVAVGLEDGGRANINSMYIYTINIMK